MLGHTDASIKLYGFIELVAGSTKLVLAAGVLLICMPLINNNKCKRGLT